MKTSVKLTAEYPYPIEEVWAALTDKRMLSQWLMETTDFEPKLGHSFQFRAKPQGSWNGIVDCQITEIVPPQRLAFTWKGGGSGGDKLGKTTVTFQLERAGSGCRLHLEHGLFEGTANVLLGKFIMGPGWKRMVTKRLPGVIDYAKAHGIEALAAADLLKCGK